ncbi:sugar ABC transporter substrate-binding protein [Georgenia sp. TF02-10]|uniref:ABC transporter substrate-binding protein n=1 Tax=Georgenia sp. TF02-10 TaxID=2917725 RepID=UPI001FA74B9A|nr:sugar ABC transporter substrate-binding protein [Georgenia sp. TF02-10]UNX53732.1 sugar ABC transporter substrate-binding protein [Georgenia sp. TF02-10]
MRRRTIKGLAVTATGALLIAGCSGGEGESATAADGRTALTVSVWNIEGTPEFNAEFDAYEEANPDIDIQPVDILADDYPEKVTAMLAGGDTTDVLTMKNVVDYARYASRGQLQDITELAESAPEGLEGLDAFDQDGKYFALPYRQDFWALYYNKGLFEELGLEVPAELTWEEYADLAKQITEEAAAAGITPAEGEKVYGTYHQIWRSLVHATAAAQTGGDQLSGEYEFFEPYYEWALDVQDAGATLDFATANSQQVTYRTMFTTEQAAMLPMGSWFIGALLQSKAAGESDVDWGIAKLPQASAGEDVTFGSPTAFAVNKNARSADAAADFVEWAAGPEGAKAVASVGATPALQSEEITEAFFALDGMPQDETSKAAFEPGEVALEMPVSEHTSDIDQILMEEHELIMTGSVPLEEGIAEMNRRVQDEVLSR